MAAHLHDRLGWDNFVEGRICALWVEMRVQEIHTRWLQRGAEFWARGLMCRLHELTHHQWLYRNATVHMKVKDGIPFERGVIGSPFAQGSGLCSTQVDTKDTHVWWVLAH